MVERTRKGSRGVALAVTLAVVLVAGCASGGDPGAGPTTPSTGPPATSAPLVLPAAYAGFRSEVYADPAHWVCRPDKTDRCDSGLDATVVAADGTLTPEPFVPATDPPVDCFYVYPTISADPTANSDLLAADAQEGAVAFGQVARLASRCRVFAPTYRQVTVSSLMASLRNEPMADADWTLAFRDVVDAWKHYLANDNGGRGVVLVGHSQGAGLLATLIDQELDPSPELRRFLVAAYIAGSTVWVPRGADVGGQFANVPLCRRPDQFGCVVSWASFRDEPGPPPDARFGRTREPDGEAACVNPAAVAGGRAVLHPYLGRRPGTAAAVIANASGSATGASNAEWVDPAKGTISTNFVTLPGFVEAECVTNSGTRYLSVHVNADPSDPRADDIGAGVAPDWGLHLIDIGLVMGDMVTLIGQQAEAFARGG